LFKDRMRVPGFEPGTSALSELRSSQLSYTRDVQPNPSPPNLATPIKKPTDSVGSPRRGVEKSYLLGGTIRRMVMGFSVGVACGLPDNTDVVNPARSSAPWFSNARGEAPDRQVVRANFSRTSPAGRRCPLKAKHLRTASCPRKIRPPHRADASATPGRAARSPSRGPSTP
jgi:hypothetical protein